MLWSFCMAGIWKIFTENYLGYILLKVKPNIHTSECNSILSIIGYHSIDVTVTKTKDLNNKHHSCHESTKAYHHEEWTKITDVVAKKFNCSSPFIPKQYR